MPGAVPLPICQRCTGLYAGAAIALILQIWVKPRPTARYLGLHGLFLPLVAPFGLHWVPDGPVPRTLTGALFGFAVVAFLWLPIREALKPNCRLFAFRDPHRAYGAGLLATLALVPLLAECGGKVGAVLLCVFACGGAVGLSLLVLANLLVWFRGIQFRCLSLGRSGLERQDRGRQHL